MKVNHLSSFKIFNFKRFKSLEVENIGQINLVVGKNNVGKTSFLESLLFSEDRVELLKNYHKTLCYRELHIHPVPEFENGQILSLNFPEENYLSYILSDINQPFVIEYKSTKSDSPIEIKIESVNYSDLSDEERNYSHSPLLPNYNPQDWIRFYINGELKEVDWLGIDELMIHKRYIPFIPMNRGYKKDMINIYNSKIQKSKSARKAFKENLKILIPNLEEVLLTKVNDSEMLSINLVERDDNIPITNLGDGTVRLARILLEITQSKNRRLMIDEASIGIHHGKLVDFWLIIIKACLRNNVQLFASTHSYESLESFIKASKKYEDQKILDKIKCIQITDIKNQELTKTKTYTFSFKEFESILSTKTEIRD